MSPAIVVIRVATKHLHNTPSHEEQSKKHDSQPIDRLNAIEQAGLLSILHSRALARAQSVQLSGVARMEQGTCDERAILRFFSLNREMCSKFPVIAQLPDEVERPCDNHGIVRSGPVQRVLQRGFRL